MTAPPEHPCSECGSIAPRVKRVADGGLCRRCYNLGRREKCSRCLRHRIPSTRTPEGAALCGHCARPKRPCADCGRVDHVKIVVDGDCLCQRCYQRPARACGRCGEVRRVAARHQHGTTDLCHSCYQLPEVECVVCHQVRMVHTTAWPLGPVCAGCYRHVLRTPSECPSCHRVKVLIGRSEAGERICGPCAGSERDYVCATCGAAGEQHFAQTCLRCSVALIAQQLLAAETGTIPPSLVGFPAALAEHGRSDSTMRWLLKPIPKALMQALGARSSITHAELDACPPSKARHHLRALLIDLGVLPPRDEQTERLGTWVNEFVGELPPHHASVITPYAHWKVLRTVRRRLRRKRTTVGVAGSARERIRIAVRLLRHLDDRGEDVATLTQEVLDRWTDGSRSRSSDITPFINWLNHSGRTEGLRVATMKSADPSEVNPEGVQHTLVRDLILGRAGTDDLGTRVAGLLVLLYGARIERLHRLTTADFSATDGRTHLTLSADPIEIPDSVAHLVQRLAETVEGSTRARTRTGEASYLFPSPRRAHEPIHPTTLGRKLTLAGVRPRITRNHALLALTADLPAAVVATQLGLTAQTTSRWAQFSQRDRIEYLVARACSTNPPT